MAQTIKAWSFSRLDVYKGCPQRAKLAFIDRIPEAPRPFKGEAPNDRGTRVHQAAEDFTLGRRTDLIHELKNFEPEMHRLRALAQEGRAVCETGWAFDSAWLPVPYDAFDKIWARVVTDVTVFVDPTKAVVIDHKGLPLDTPIPTTAGWTTMGEIKVGDQLFDQLGRPCAVTEKSAVKHLPNYRITFDDATSVQCDNEHLWTLSNGNVVPVVALKPGDTINVARPLELPTIDLPLHPYVLGVWLADGRTGGGEITKPDDGIWDQIVACGYQISHDYSEKAANGKCRVHTVYGLRTILREMDLLGRKRIPPVYLRASIEQRTALLQGLMDGDGSANPLRKQVVLNTVDEALAYQIQELALSLGQRATVHSYIGRGFDTSVVVFSVTFRPNGLQPFRLQRKLDKTHSWGPGRAERRRIKTIEEVTSVPTQCIAVDSPDRTYLCTRHFIPTHNTGKRFGNEVKHGRQMQLYALAAALRYPKLEKITTELWYQDQNELATQEFTRKQAMKFWKGFNDDALEMTSATEFPPRPNQQTCRFCPFRTGRNKWIQGTGHCKLNPPDPTDIG